MLIERNNTSGYNYSLSFKFNKELVEHCKYLSEKYGFRRFTFFDGSWRFTDLDVVVELKDRYPEIQISDDIKSEYELADYMVKESILAKANTELLKNTRETNLEIKGIKGTLLPYQKIGVQFFINSNGRAMNSDPMGSGKSLQSLAYIAHSGIKLTLVICPSVVKYNWKNEIKKWTNLKSLIIDSKSDVSDLLGAVEKTNFFIINYDILPKFLPFLTTVQWQAAILDEVHYCKNKKSIRTKAVRKIVSKIQKIIMLSGTPFLNRPIELFAPLNMLDPKTWHDYYSFGRRYCDGHSGRYGWDDKGSSNIAELQERISPYFIRRSKAEILPDLPQKRFINHPVELDAKTQKEYKLAEEELAEFLINIKKKTEKEAARSLQAEKLVKLGALRQLTSNGKIEASKELIQNIIENGEKVVVFSCYNHPLEELHEFFKDISVLVTGKVGAKERDDFVNDFQNNSEKKIFFGGIGSAGVGINLTAATNALFIDYAWRPGDHAQAIDRIHRIGSTAKHITIYQLYSKKTVDEYMYKLLSKKQLLFDQLIDGKEIPKEMSKSYTSSLMRIIERRSLKNKTLQK